MSAVRIVQASLLNNEGAIHYSRGKLTEAMTCFRRALESMITFVNDPTVSSPAVHGPGTVSPCAIASLHLSKLQAEGSAFHPKRSDGKSEPLFFDNPVVFDEVIPNNQEAHLIFCGVVVFNMGLTSHAKGDDICLAKALQLYDASIDFFRRANYQGTVFASLVAACLNNKIQIYFDASQYDDMERDSTSLTLAMQDANRSPATKSILLSNDFEAILLNILLLRRPVVAEAA